MKLYSKMRDIFSLDLRSLAVFRIGLALLILYDLCARAEYLFAHYTDAGILSRIAAKIFWGDRLVFSLHFFSGEAWFQIILFFVAALFAISLLLGYKTKLVTILSWIFLVSIQVRNPMIAQGGDLLLRIALFWAMFLPLGARYSMDSIKRPILQKSNTFTALETAAYSFQIVFMYIFAAMFKLYSPAWTSEGTAIYYSLFFTPSATSLGHYLLNFPDLLSFLTLSTIWFELFWIFLLFSPIYREKFRLVCIFGLISFHIGLSLTINPELFPFIGIITILAFLPALFWSKIFSYLKLPKFTKLKIYYDGECGFCKNTVIYIKAFFLLSQTKIISALEHEDILKDMLKYNSWVVVDERGERFYKFEGFVAISKASPLLFFLVPIFNLSPIKRFGTYAYEYIASHRKRKCIVAAEEVVKEKINDKSIWNIRFILNASKNVLLLFLIVLIFLWNLATLRPNLIKLPVSMRNLIFVTGINQRWAMFSAFPNPFKIERWLDIDGILIDGTHASIPPYDNYRWMKYMVRLSWPSSDLHRMYFGQFLCNDWNASHDINEQISSLSIRRVIMFIPPPNSSAEIQAKTSFWKYSCAL